MENSEQSSEATAILQVIADESAAFWHKDFDAWAKCWVHAAYIRRLGWWAEGGITVTEGWDALSERVRTTMIAYPEPNPTALQVRRENVNLRVNGNMAWVTFDQYGQDTGDLQMDMPGLSRETRFMEKHHDEWKIVYVGWLLEGE
ncbi:MAG: nuclear transport factor 2 family protein [Anaerolineae bacterium]|nr:nuclear transport factor 2 family protein [Anaerolineae bacterium]